MSDFLSGKDQSSVLRKRLKRGKRSNSLCNAIRGKRACWHGRNGRIGSFQRLSDDPFSNSLHVHLKCQTGGHWLEHGTRGQQANLIKNLTVIGPDKVYFGQDRAHAFKIVDETWTTSSTNDQEFNNFIDLDALYETDTLSHSSVSLQKTEILPCGMLTIGHQTTAGNPSTLERRIQGVLYGWTAASNHNASQLAS